MFMASWESWFSETCFLNVYFYLTFLNIQKGVLAPVVVKFWFRSPLSEHNFCLDKPARPMTPGFHWWRGVTPLPSPCIKCQCAVSFSRETGENTHLLVISGDICFAILAFTSPYLWSSGLRERALFSYYLFISVMQYIQVSHQNWRTLEHESCHHSKKESCRCVLQSKAHSRPIIFVWWV